jgi:uncharacterized protein GlcG (DUF336 family)
MSRKDPMVIFTSRTAALTLALSISIVAEAQAQAPAPPSAAPAPVPRARGPSLALAVEAAQTAAATCTANGFKTTVLVTDSAGVPVVLLSGDGAGERTQTIAPTKIATALRYNSSSGEVLTRTKTDAALDAALKADPKIGTVRAGALLLKAGNDTIGAIAVSGAPGGDKDEVCAQAGVDKVKDRLR